MIVCKFGGSSLAGAEQFRRVASIVRADPRRTVIVVSAPGRRSPDDPKVTDLLYTLHSHLLHGVPDEGIWETVAARYREIGQELSLPGVDEMLEETSAQLSPSTDESFLVSRGEYFCAKLLAAYLGFTFVDAADILRFSFDGSLNLPESERLAREAYDAAGPMVLPGFYGAYPGEGGGAGDIVLFPRGGSDVSGAYLARFLGAEVYENWTDVSGIRAADPRIVPHPHAIATITYEELRELSYMGAGVLHDESILPVQERGIAIHLRNTEDPTHPGTIISCGACREEAATPITGIAGKRGFVSFTIYKKHMSSEVGFLRRVLSIFEKYNISVEHTPSGMDRLSVIVAEGEGKLLHAVTADLEAIPGVSVKVERGLSLIAVVGRGMVGHPGICRAVFSILGEENINVRMIAQAPDELTVIIGVPDNLHERAIRALYEGLVRAGLL